MAPDLGENESSGYIEFQPTIGSVDGKQQLGPKVRIEWLRDPLDPVPLDVGEHEGQEDQQEEGPQQVEDRREQTPHEQPRTQHTRAAL